ncbi:MAG: hypothetical protein OQK69_10860 [Gammaproteobacteria bacterium]|nr:hypothetical protein [Gammaproteobacteria bacterium]
MELFTAKNISLASLALVISFSMGPVSAEVEPEKITQQVTEEIAKEVTGEAGTVLLENVFDLEVAEKSPVAFQSLEQMDELLRLGMPALALRLLTQEQKNWPVYSNDWYAFERKHVSLLMAMDEWQQVIERSESLLKQANPEQQISVRISRWFSTQQVIARMRLGQAEAALAQLRNLLWNSSQTNSEVNDADIVALWRRLVIRAYLAMNADDDAQKALLRYQHDYSSNHQNLNLDWRLLQARSLLRTDRAEEVITLLVDSKSNISQALRLLAALRARPDHAELYAQEAQGYINELKLNRGEMWAYQYVLYQVYLKQDKLAEATQVMKNLLLLGEAYSVLGEEFAVSGDDLWALYITIGQQTGNRSKLLLGDDLAWYNKAYESQENNAVEALGLYAVLAFNAEDVARQQLAHREIVAILSKDKKGLELINQLYLHGTKISSLESLPSEVRYSLVDYALSKSDMKLAVRLMQSLQQPPKDQDQFFWAMRKARVLILEGAYENGEAVLANTISTTEAITEKQLDHFLQVIFDLQAVQRHQQVLTLLDSLKPEWMDDSIQRELFFWKAESYAGLEQYDRAAWSYLKSAQLADQVQADLWAQSARYKAAGVLVKAGLFDDAQVIYTRLLQVTSSASRKSAIRQELQQIRLLRNAEKNTSDEH